MSDQAVRLAGASAGQGQRAGRVGAKVRAALLLGHSHTEQNAGLLRGRPKPLVVGTGENLRFPLGGDVGLAAQRRDGCVRHRGRTHDAGLDLPEEKDAGRPSDVRSLSRLGPGTRVQPVLDAQPEEGVPGGVVLDLVSAPADAVVRVNYGRVPVREETELDRLFPAEELAERGEPFGRPRRPLAGDGFAERAVGGEEVVAGEGRRHVRDLVGLELRLARLEAAAEGLRGAGRAESVASSIHRRDPPALDEVVKLAASW